MLLIAGMETNHRGLICSPFVTVDEFSKKFG